MTIKEAFHQFVKPFVVDDGAAEIALINADLDGSAQYTASLKASVERSTIDTLLQEMSVISESESQFSTSKDAKLLRERLLYLARKYGRNDIVSIYNVRIKNISRMR